MRDYLIFFLLFAPGMHKYADNSILKREGGESLHFVRSVAMKLMKWGETNEMV